jgi:hypothetical protein
MEILRHYPGALDCSYFHLLFHVYPFSRFVYIL